jgi:hypothetical protein
MSIKRKLVTMFYLTRKSENKKTGRMTVSTSPNWTCPEACPLREHGCYSSYGKIYMWWRLISNTVGDANLEYENFLQRIKKLPNCSYWRHNQAGDFVPAVGYRNRISVQHALSLAIVGKGKRGFTYTHYPVVKMKGTSQRTINSNRSTVCSLNDNGFTVNVSANNPSHADEILDSGITVPVVTVLPRHFVKEKIAVSKTPKGRTILTCPAIIQNGMNCRKCRICMNSKRKVIIGFPVHGSGFAHCERITNEMTNHDNSK